MTLIEFLLLLLLAAIIGVLGETLAGFSAGGLLVSIIVGFAGALLGRWLAGELGLPGILTISIDGRAFPVIWSIVGAAILRLVLGALRGAARR